MHLISFCAIARMVMSKMVSEDGVTIAAVRVRENQANSSAAVTGMPTLSLLTSSVCVCGAQLPVHPYLCTEDSLEQIGSFSVKFFTRGFAPSLT